MCPMVQCDGGPASMCPLSNGTVWWWSSLNVSNGTVCMMVVQLYRLPIVYLILRQLHWKFMKIIQQKEREREAAARPDERSLV